jgi:hypothetical protein
MNTIQKVSHNFLEALSKISTNEYEEYINKNIDKVIELLEFSSFPKLKHSYSRTVLAKLDNGFEIMVAKWDKNALSSIHGHPQLAFYKLLQGKVEIEYFNKSSQHNLDLLKKEILISPDYCYYYGESNIMDNHIHQVRSLEESMSIHIYSGNALDGIRFLR